MGPRARTTALARWLLLAALVAWVRAPASAQDAASALSLVAPTGCPDELALESELASLVGRPVEQIVLPVGLDPRVTITADDARFILEVRDADGTRTLRDGSCTALVRAAALIIALRIDADAATLAVATAAEPEPEAQHAPSAPAVPSHPAPSRTIPLRGRRRGYDFDAFEWSRRLAVPYGPPALPTFSIGVGGIVEAGIVPVISASLAVDLVVRVERFEARVRAAYVLDQRQAASAGIAASAVLGTVLACARPFEADFAIAFCAGVEAGPLLARSYGVTNSGQSAPWTVAGVLGVWLPLFPWRGIDISLGAEAWGRFYRPQFEIGGFGRVWDTELFGGRFALLVHFNP